MSLPVPKLDDVEFERLVEEARGLIPRYAPDWTDHNVHDPGITLLELLAWIVDQQVYQVGFVSDEHLTAFAALLGVRPRGPLPARGLVWPTDNVIRAADLSRGASASTRQQPDVAFQLDTDVYLSAARLKGLQAILVGKPVQLQGFNREDRASVILEPSERNAGILELLFNEPIVRPIAGRSPIGLVAIGIEVMPVRRQGEGLPKRWGPLVFEYKASTLPWQPVEVVRDDTYALLRTGVVLLKVPVVDDDRPSRLRLRLDLGFFPISPKIVRICLNVLPIVQFETVSQAVLGRSNGLPDQRLALDTKDLPDPGAKADRPLVIKVDGGELGYRAKEKRGDDDWSPTDDFARHGPADQVYRLDRERGLVIFGNGVNGRVPPRGAQIFHNAFNITRGENGNLTADLTWQVAGASVRGESYGTNPEALSGGENAWDIDRLMAEARRRALARRVLLTNAELQRAAEGLAGFAVARADVLVRYHPSLPDREVGGSRTLAVTPWRAPAQGQPPPVSETYLQALDEALRRLRLLGERLSIIAPRRVPIRVRARLFVVDDVDRETLKQRAHAVLSARLSDLAFDDDIEAWPLGRPVTLGEIEALLAGIEGVIAVQTSRLARGDGAFGKHDIKLARDEVAIGAAHELHLVQQVTG